MASSFKGVDLFGSGPHRFTLGRQGHLVIPDVSFGIFEPGSFPYGLVELDVIVTGRLVAASDAALWVLRDAITGAFEDEPTPGTLVDLQGRAWNTMSFIRYEEQETVDRGRVVSIGYVATFRRFLQLAASAPDRLEPPTGEPPIGEPPLGEPLTDEPMTGDAA